MEEALEKLGLEIIQFMGNLVPQDTGDLLRSFHMEVVYENKNWILRIYSTKEYAQWVNDGTKPHMPPISAIEGWCKRKGLEPWAVAMNIKKYGTKPHQFIPTANDIRQRLKYAKFDQAIKDKIDKIIQKNNLT